MKRFKKLLWLFTALLLFLQVGACKRTQPTAPPPRLVVLVAVDQMRADYLDRFQSRFTGGFKRLLTEGVVFKEAYHQHAFTETGVGHATLSTGSYPEHHGIVANNWFNRQTGRKLYCVEDQDQKVLADNRKGRSPKNLLHTALGDWLKSANPGSKVFSMALKDRSAILMGGKHPDGAFWYHKKSGQITSSTYYFKELPQWVVAFNNKKYVDKYFSTGWTRLLPANEYQESRQDAFPNEFDGVHTTFPHRLTENSSAPDQQFYENIYYTPFGDELILKFAEETVRTQKLGVDNDPDLLFVGCSAADAIGHRFGPYSQEVEDYYLRLDRYLNEFFQFLDQTVGKSNYVVALSSDHGVLPIPEELQHRGIKAGRIPYREFKTNVNQAIQEVNATFKISSDKIYLGMEGGLYFNHAAFHQLNIDSVKYFNMLKAKLLKIPHIKNVYTFLDFQNPSQHQNDEYFQLFLNNYFPPRSPDVQFLVEKNYLISGSNHGTSHGTPYRYDRHVPLIFEGANLTPQKISRSVATIDLAPTLANLLGIQPQQADGRSLMNFLK